MDEDRMVEAASSTRLCCGQKAPGHLLSLSCCATVPYEVPHGYLLPEEGGALLITDAG